MASDFVDDLKHHQAVVQVHPILLVNSIARCVEEPLDINMEAQMHFGQQRHLRQLTHSMSME